MSLEQFKSEAHERGIKHILRETTVYESGIKVGHVVYAEQNACLVGCWSERNGGKWFAKPMRSWSRSRRKFDKVATHECF